MLDFCLFKKNADRSLRNQLQSRPYGILLNNKQPFKLLLLFGLFKWLKWEQYHMSVIKAVQRVFQVYCHYLGRAVQIGKLGEWLVPVLSASFTLRQNYAQNKCLIFPSCVYTWPLFFCWGDASRI